MPPAANRCLGTAIAGKTSDNVKMAAVGRIYECDATFGNHCLDLGTEIASKTSHNVKVPIGGRTYECGATLCTLCYDIGTEIASKTSHNYGANGMR